MMKFKRYWILTLTVWAVILTACGGLASSNQPEENVDQSSLSSQITMIIGPQLVDCVGEGPRQCMQVKYEPDEDWQFFYNQIEGFDYQPGYRYTLLVERLEQQDPPAGGSSLRYVLVDVIDKIEELKVNAGDLPGTTWVLNGYGNLSQTQGVLEKVVVSLEYDPETGQLSGSSGCNRYFGDVVVDGDQLTFSAGPMGMTRMACSDPIMKQEAAFIELLGRATRFAIQDGMLFLFTDSDEVLTFSPGESPAGRQ
jgi:heat shock protein HslJ